MPSEPLIRQYQPKDRGSIRTICADTANRGDPAETFFADRELISDVVTSYYTDYEPSSVWVAEINGKVVGYITGCLNFQRYNRLMVVRITPEALVKAVFRGVLLHHTAWQFIWAGTRTILRGRFFRKIPVDIYPVHLHIDITSGFRGKQIGRKLMEHFIGQVRQEGLRGMHAIVREDNSGGCQFFERMGFKIVQGYSVFLPEERGYYLGRVRVYGRQI